MCVCVWGECCCGCSAPRVGAVRSTGGTASCVQTGRGGEVVHTKCRAVVLRVRHAQGVGGRALNWAPGLPRGAALAAPAGLACAQAGGGGGWPVGRAHALPGLLRLRVSNATAQTRRGAVCPEPCGNAWKRGERSWQAPAAGRAAPGVQGPRSPTEYGGVSRGRLCHRQLSGRRETKPRPPQLQGGALGSNCACRRSGCLLHRVHFFVVSASL